jgi:DNA-binding NarL/FixJ family response regulator
MESLNAQRSSQRSVDYQLPARFTRLSDSHPGSDEVMREAMSDVYAGEHQPNLRRLRVAIVNDYEVVVAGVLAMLTPYSRQVSVVELDVEEDPAQVVDVALFDTYGRPGLGLGRVRSPVRSHHVGAVVVYTWNMTEAARKAAYDAGANAVIAKSLPAQQLVASLQAVAGGQTVDTGRFRTTKAGSWPGAHWGLSARESETLALVATGMPNREIAEAMFVSENTVRTHLKSIFRKLGVSNRSQALARMFADPTFTVRHGDGGAEVSRGA